MTCFYVFLSFTVLVCFFNLLLVIFEIATFGEHYQGCTVKLELAALSLHVHEYLQVCAVTYQHAMYFHSLSSLMDLSADSLLALFHIHVG